jgi:ketosteroid isomerase-like protein
MAPGDDEQAVAEAERALAAAHLALDFDTFDHLLHPTYVNLQPDGSTESKVAVLASLRSGERRWDRAEVDQLGIRVYGDAAVVVGRWRASGRNGAVRFDYAARFLSVWVREGDRWQNVAYQATELPPLPN